MTGKLINQQDNYDANFGSVFRSSAIFYKPKDIYLEQLNIFDPRQIYDNVSLASYIKTDKVAIKANALHEINLKKQRLLIELEQLKNGKI